MYFLKYLNPSNYHQKVYDLSSSDCWHRVIPRGIYVESCQYSEQINILIESVWGDGGGTWDKKGTRRGPATYTSSASENGH